MTIKLNGIYVRLDTCKQPTLLSALAASSTANFTILQAVGEAPNSGRKRIKWKVMYRYIL